MRVILMRHIIYSTRGRVFKVSIAVIRNSTSSNPFYISLNWALPSNVTFQKCIYINQAKFPRNFLATLLPFKDGFVSDRGNNFKYSSGFEPAPVTYISKELYNGVLF